jgi:DNA-binding SARP family transcriptional activator
MPVLHIRLLGGLNLAWGDAPLPPIPGTAARSLFAYLATYRDRPHTRDLLAGTFWPDLPDDTARRRLSQALWLIRRVLRQAQNEARQAQDEALERHPLLLTEGDTVQLHPELPVWIDVEEFEKLVQREIGKSVDWESGTNLPTSHSSSLQALAEAVDLYRGDFMDGYYDDWLLVERERLRETFLGVLERLVTGLKAWGEYEPALAYARRLAGEDPLREEAHAEVMRLCHLLRRDHEALQQYQLCCQVLAEELAAKPSADTAALAAEIAAQAGPSEAPYLPVAPYASPLRLLDRPDQVPLVGREAERAELARHLEQAAAGQGGLLLVVGGAGVGKTRLMQEVARDAAWRGIRVVWGQCCELCAPPPYQPLADTLRTAGLDHLTPVWRGELARLLPELGPTPPAQEPEQERARLLEALTQAFLGLGRAAPHLLILEDIQWLDAASFEALRLLLPRLPTSPLLVVGTLRPEELAALPDARRSLAALETTRIPRRLELTPLTEAETEALIRRVLAQTQPGPPFSRRLYEQTEGNPFFVAETLRALVEEGQLYRDPEGAWRTPWDAPLAGAASTGYAEMPVPHSITQSIERRLARMSPAVHDLLGLASVMGRQVEFDVWLAASEGGEGATLRAGEALVRRGLLVESDDPVGYRFAHDLIRQVAYEALGAVRRQRWHRRVAAALESLYPDRVEALARHHALGQDWTKAVDYAQRAGERAQAVYAHQQALGYYASAEAWLAEGRVTLPAAEIARQQAALAERRGQVHSFVGDYEAAGAAFAQACQLWDGLEDRQGVARVLNRLSFMHFVQYDYRAASHYAELALATLPETDPPVVLRAASLTYLGLSAWTEGHFADALPPLQQALTLLEELGTDPYGLARCLNSLGLVHLDRGEFEQAAPCFARSLALRRQIGDRRGEAWCWHNQGRLALAQGDLATARERLEMARSIFAEIEHPDGLDTCARTLARVEQAGAPQRALTAAAGQASQISVRLPRADAPLGRTLHDDEYVGVTWTVDLPEDAAIAGKAARRRHRLLRLLAEAQDQGAVPAYYHLAEALGVSERTVERDMVVLRQEYSDLPPTRRKMSE